MNSLKAMILCVIGILLIPFYAEGDENIALYGMKGYAYTYSPLPTDGLHIQVGGMYSLFQRGNLFHDDNLNCRDGYVWYVPASLTYGDGKWWEASVATHWEYWENTDFEKDEKGIGDVFLGAKFHILDQERGMPLDLSVMPYMLIPTGSRDKSIGDIYLYNPTEDDSAYGFNLLLGLRRNPFYFAVNLGINYVNTDLEYIEDKTFFLGLTAEYQISETMTSYLEFISNENKNRENYSPSNPCYDEDTDDDIRELGLGLVYVKDQWGVKFHVGAGMTSTSPDYRAMAMVNRSFSF